MEAALSNRTALRPGLAAPRRMAEVAEVVVMVADLRVATVVHHPVAAEGAMMAAAVAALPGMMIHLLMAVENLLAEKGHLRR